MASADDFNLPADDEDEAPRRSSGKDLRDQLESQLAENRKLKEQLSQLAAEQRKSGLSSTFKDLGVDAKYAKLYSDEDVSPEAVKKWAEEFGFIAGSVADEEPSAERQAAARISQASASAPTVPTGDLGTRLAQFKTFQEAVDAGAIVLDSTID